MKRTEALTKGSMLYKKFGFTIVRLREVLADKRLNKIISHGKKSISLKFFLRLQNQAICARIQLAAVYG